MIASQLYKSIQKKQSFLSVGLDTDIQRLPKHLLEFEDPIFEFNKSIIDATSDLCVAYKPNLAFYESRGAKGWESLRRTMEYMPDDVFKIADAKRGDIGNTAQQYARAIFKELKFDAVTLSPYMGEDTVRPFLEYEDKTVILLALTSNESSQDFQRFSNGEHQLFEKVLQTSKNWGSTDQIMYVVGATHPEEFALIRKHVPEHFLLVPGIGAQGGDLSGVCKHGLNDRCGLIVNSSRGIIFASPNEDYPAAARIKAQELQAQMQALLPAID